MVFSVTGLAFLFLSFTTGFIAYRAFKYWQRVRDNISKLFFYSFAFYFLFCFHIGIVGLFFADSPQMIVGSMMMAPLLQCLGSFFALCIVIYRIFPRISGKIVYLIVLSFLMFLCIGGLATYLSTKTQFQPFLDNHWAINWGIPSDINPLLPLLRLFPFLFGLIPLTIILIRDYIRAEPGRFRARVRAFMLFYLLVIVVVFLEFVIFWLKAATIFRDIGLIITSIAVLVPMLRTSSPLRWTALSRQQN